MGLQAKQSNNTKHRFDTDWKANKDAAASTSQDTSQPTQICQGTRCGGQGRPSLFRMPIKEDGGMSIQTKERDYNIGHTISSSVSVFVLLGFSDFEREERLCGISKDAWVRACLMHGKGEGGRVLGVVLAPQNCTIHKI